MQIVQPKPNSANASTQTHDRSTYQPDTFESSMENRDDKLKLTSNEQNATKTLPLSSMQRESTMENGPPLISESNPESGLTSPTLCDSRLPLPFPLILELFLLLKMLLNTSRGNLGVNTPSILNLLNTLFNPSTSLPSQLSSERAQPLYLIANATAFALASAMFNPNSSAGKTPLV